MQILQTFETETGLGGFGLDNDVFQMVQVKLLAAVTKVDGKILEIENTVAESMIDAGDSSEWLRMKSLYQEELSSETTAQDIDEIISLIETATDGQKERLVRMLSSVAICDGHLHPHENDLINGVKLKLSA